MVYTEEMIFYGIYFRLPKGSKKYKTNKTDMIFLYLGILAKTDKKGIPDAIGLNICNVIFLKLENTK